MKGGKILSNKKRACILKPSIKCKNKKTLKKNSISKILVGSNANKKSKKEMNMNKTIKKLKKSKKWSKTFSKLCDPPDYKTALSLDKDISKCFKVIKDKQSIYEATIYSLRKNISLVSQDTTLFDDTIMNNIIYANSEASKEEVKQAAKFSYAEEFIENLPNKFDTLIGENGIRLSGGEKQRLSIARAILKKSPIILLDEATSSLDAETEDKIQKAINFLTKGRTTVVIAHRLSTILNSDKIYVIDSGNVVGEGKHNDLLNSSEVYKNFYEKQIRKE